MTCAWLAWRACPVHPRACGEHIDTSVMPPDCVGSSPRLRGTYPTAAQALPARRFIPAPAGNIQPQLPRRGDPPGSSPRLRGTSACSPAQRRSPRFIPAPAGNIRRTTRTRSRTSVHPRACGEHVLTSGLFPTSSGSSPRLRGTFGDVDSRRLHARFIPAPAGNILGIISPLSWWPVHPRACGEHATASRNSDNLIGSSPRLRGT